MARLRLRLLGPFEATLDGKPLSGFASNKVRALLAYLAVESARPHPRSVLAALLWPEQPEQAALAMLRHALSNLRHVIGDPESGSPFFLATRETVQFNTASDCWLDVAAFADLVSPDRSDQPPVACNQLAVDLYLGHFLEGFTVGDSDAFEEWAVFRREQLDRQVLQALFGLAAYYEERGKNEQGQVYARRQLELEPWREEAHQQLMRMLALGGQRSAALAQYETCRRLLAQELGVEPAPETILLYESIRDGRPIEKRVAVASVSPRSPVAGTADAEGPLFVGREHELASLNRHLEMALAGSGRVVFVTGDAGCGKTVLLREFAGRAMRKHGDLLAAGGSCDAQTGIGALYAPFREIMQVLTGDVEARRAQGDTAVSMPSVSGTCCHTRCRPLWSMARLWSTYLCLPRLCQSKHRPYHSGRRSPTASGKRESRGC